MPQLSCSVVVEYSPSWFVPRKPSGIGCVLWEQMLSAPGSPGTRQAPEAAEEKQSRPDKVF